MHYMRKFWRRNANAQAQLSMLQEKKRRLLEEQQHLMARITDINKVVDPCGLTHAITVKPINVDKGAIKSCKCTTITRKRSTLSGIFN